MDWEYRTILFEYHKDGLLGDKYIDDEQVEKVLNEQGEKGWELVGVTPVQEGLLSFFKRPGNRIPPDRARKRTGDEQPVPDVQSSPLAGTHIKEVEESRAPGRSESVQRTTPPDDKANRVGEIKIS